MLHVQPNTTTTAISPESPTDCIPKWSLEQDSHHPGPMEQEDPVPPPPPPLTEDDEYFFLNQPPPPPPPIPPSMLLSSSQEEPAMNDDEDDEDGGGGMMAMMDDKYETATRIFYATMQKFAGPSNHRRTFLESWHLHSMYSKSQQILLGIPNAQSMVYLSGDDFMFTPQLVPQDTTAMMDQMEFDWEEEEEEEEEDDLPPIMMMPATTMMEQQQQQQEQDASPPPLEENDVMVMSAPAPVMDENLWMAPDKDVSGISLDAVDFYRHGSPSPPPSALYELDSNEKGKETLRLPAQEQQETTTTPTTTTTNNMEEKEHGQRDKMNDIPQSSDTTTTTTPPYYGTLMTSPSQQQQQRDIVQQQKDDLTERLLQWPILHASERLAHDLLLAFELAEDFVDNNKKGLRTVSSFFVYLIRIWHVLFVCAEMLLGSLGSNTHQRRRPWMNDELV